MRQTLLACLSHWRLGFSWEGKGGLPSEHLPCKLSLTLQPGAYATQPAHKDQLTRKQGAQIQHTHHQSLRLFLHMILTPHDY